MRDIKKELGSKATGMEYLEAFLRYSINATDKITEQDIKDIFINTLPQGSDTKCLPQPKNRLNKAYSR